MGVHSSHLQRKRRRPGRALLLLTQPTVLALLVMFVLTQWRIPTRVEVDATCVWPENLHNSRRLLDPQALEELFPLVLRSGNIRYPNFPEQAVVILPSSSWILGLETPGALRLLTFTSNAPEREFRIRFQAAAAQIVLTSARGLRRDVRLTRFARMRRNPFAFWGGVAVWLGLTALGWVKLYQELR